MDEFYDTFDKLHNIFFKLNLIWEHPDHVYEFQSLNIVYFIVFIAIVFHYVRYRNLNTLYDLGLGNKVI